MPDTVAPVRRLRFSTIAILFLVLLPLMACGVLMKSYVTDQRFLDDWVWAQDLLTWEHGDYWQLFHNIMSVHLEHRPAVARALGLLVTVLAKGNVEAQNGLTFLWLLVCLGGLFHLWMRRGALELRRDGAAWFLIVSILCTPMQWQNLLWPICHETPMPMMFLLLALCLAGSKWPWWVRSLLGTVFAILGMLSFGSGFLLWGLPLPVMLWNGRFTGNRQRAAFVALWGLVFVIAMLVYLQVKIQPVASIVKEKTLLHLPSGYDLTFDLHNEVPPQYAYHHGDENTVNGEAVFFLAHPLLATEFVATFTGAILTRGWSADLKTTSEIAGDVLLVALLAVCLYFWRNRNDVALRQRLLPAICFGAYTPLTGLMVSIGRMYAGGTGSALNGRYTVHQTQILIALVISGVLIARHWSAKRAEAGRLVPASGPVWAIGGILMGVIAVGWIHGQAMMFEWQSARFRGAAAQFLSDQFPKFNQFVGFVAGSHEMCKETAYQLNQYGLLKRGLAKTDKLLEIWHESKPVGDREKKLAEERSEFERLYRDEEGNWRIKGWSFLPKSYRPSDAILLAYRVPGGEWTMFGFTQATGVPHYLARSLGKDMYSFMPGHDPIPSSVTCGWNPSPYIEKEPPPGAMISAWSLDYYSWKVFRVTRSQHGKPDSEDGFPMEELARIEDHN